MAEPEKLNLWDRLFNRYREEPIKEISEKWYKEYHNQRLEGSEYIRIKLKFKRIDRLTGSETIEYCYID